MVMVKENVTTVTVTVDTIVQNVDNSIIYRIQKLICEL